MWCCPTIVIVLWTTSCYCRLPSTRYDYDGDKEEEQVTVFHCPYEKIHVDNAQKNIFVVSLKGAVLYLNYYITCITVASVFFVGAYLALLWSLQNVKNMNLLPEATYQYLYSGLSYHLHVRFKASKLTWLRYSSGVLVMSTVWKMVSDSTFRLDLSLNSPGWHRRGCVRRNWTLVFSTWTRPLTKLRPWWTSPASSTTPTSPPFLWTDSTPARYAIRMTPSRWQRMWTSWAFSVPLTPTPKVFLLTRSSLNFTWPTEFDFFLNSG